MKVGLMADSHDNLPMIRKAIEYFNQRQDIAFVLHAGDFVAPFAVEEMLAFKGKLVGVFGNNDGEKEGIRRVLDAVHEGTHLVALNGRKILMVHHLAWAPTDKMNDADVVVYGHTHRHEIVPGPPLRINPGEVGAWVTGNSTICVLDLESMSARIHEFDLASQSWQPR